MARTSPFHGEDFTGSSPVRATINIYGAAGVKVSIPDCGSVGFGSSPGRPPPHIIKTI